MRVAQRLGELPSTSAAFGRGELSLDQVRAVVQHVPASHEASAATVATQLMVPQLTAALRRYRFDGEAEPQSSGGGASDPAAEPRCYLSFGSREDGFWTLNGRLRGEDGAVVERALEAARNQVYRESASEAGPGERVEVSWIDGLLRLTDLAASNPSQPRSARDRYRTLVHVDAETLADWSQGRRRELHLGPWLGPDVVERITCDTDAQCVVERHGLAVAYTAEHPNVPRRIRQRIEDRDRGCRFPGCSRRRGTEVHHLVHRADGGPTSEHNLICLCERHHRDHHRGEFDIAGDPTTPTGLEFTARTGVGIAGPAPPRQLADPPNGNYRHPPGYRVDRRWFQVNPSPSPRFEAC